MTITAWNGIVTMHNAAWGDEAGSTVTFKLPMVKGADHSRNPFHAFTKRRKGHAGTRFYMVVNAVDPAHMIYKDEVMLAGWNDSQQNGHTVKFWICNDKMGHPFEGVGRAQELALTLAELDDDNAPIDQKMREKVEKQVQTGKQKMSNIAAMFCRTLEFHEWVGSLEDDLYGPPTSEEEAKEWMYHAVGISSRAELDRDSVAANRFTQDILKPYQKWYNDNYEAPF